MKQQQDKEATAISFVEKIVQIFLHNLSKYAFYSYAGVQLKRA